VTGLLITVFRGKQAILPVLFTAAAAATAPLNKRQNTTGKVVSREKETQRLGDTLAAIYRVL